MPVQKLVMWLCGMAFAGWPPMVGEAAAPTVDVAVSEIIPSATEPPKVLVIIRNLGSQPLKRTVEVELWLDDQLLGRQGLEETLKPREPVYVEFARPV
ncbi:MAG: hypothetical protein Q8R91_01450, partial [Candidatus Omnitrophota bacterium]|nr:hypothetical protein [Candidatus Omnitrophota bacterium]